MKQGSTSTKLRKHPIQARSRKRVRNILQQAAVLITEHGADQLKMSAIAKRAQVPIGSVYQYFPNKSAIVRQLAEEQLQKLRNILQQELTKIDDSAEPVAQIVQVIDGIIDTYYYFYRHETAFSALWSGVQADALLNDLEIQDTKDSAALLEPVLAKHYAHLDRDYLSSFSLLICTQIGASLRFIMQLEEKKAASCVLVLKQQLTTLATAMAE